MILPKPSYVLPRIWDFLRLMGCSKNMGRETGHERMLQRAIDALRAQGIRVVRLDRRITPDAIAINGTKVIAVEAEPKRVRPINANALVVQTYREFDDVVVLEKPLPSRYHSHLEYEEALRLRRQGSTYDQIVASLKKKFGRSVSRNIVHCWVKGKSKPLDAK